MFYLVLKVVVDVLAVDVLAVDVLQKQFLCAFLLKAKFKRLINL